MSADADVLLKHIKIEPKEAPQACVIWLHGLGADGHDFEPIVPQLKLPKTLPVRFIFPHAPVIPVTLNAGYAMPAWFDIISLSPQLQIDIEGFYAATQAVSTFIENEIEQGIPADKIILAGFSQGGAIALYCGIHSEVKLGGILGLSTFVPNEVAAFYQQGAQHKDVPIMLAHGTADDIVPLNLGESTKQLLTNIGYQVHWHQYPMPHSVCDEEIEDVSNWLQNVLA